ncbi:MAG: patatin-like phospholipase family protein [Cyclobacteriaceae bacterium]|nr:patatin-like phospholipase family protein [Cyclobacteriaceae bacterium]
MRLWVFFGLVCLAISSHAQKVGLVLSGGAAKGIAHVGVLKALEENEIPIDYITGTSMGGIVGGCYAAGMSPAQIEEIILSKEFLQWVNGQLEDGHNYYFTRDDDDASFLRLNLSLDSTFSILFNSSLASDLSLNFALAEKLAQPSAIAHNNFDSLFVPLRVIASDIFTQTAVSLGKGALSDAIRATQTVPFFYNPIRIDGRYLFDGGLYENFPVGVMQQTFKPDVIIGSNVSSKIYNEYPYGEDDKLIARSLLYMLLDKSNPSDIPESGVYIQPDLKGYTSFDFAKARALIDSGYSQTLRQMEEIKSKIAARVSCDAVAEARNKFNNRSAPFLIDHIEFDGFNPSQQKYINRFFKSGKRPLTFNEIKSGFYTLVSEYYFKNLYPGFTFNEAENNFNFTLSKRPQNNFPVDFGGAIATRGISHIYLGLNYYHFNRSLTHANLNFYLGNFYKSVQAKARIDIPNRGVYYLEPYATVNDWDFLQGRDLFRPDTNPTALSRIDRKMGVDFAIPFGKNYKLKIGGAYINNRDQYINSPVLVSTDTLDVLRLDGLRSEISVSSNTLNRKQYASNGRNFMLSLNWFNMNEKLVPGNTSVIDDIKSQSRNWLRARITLEQYFRKGFYSSGYLLDGVLSNQPVFSNYQGSIINAPGFNPLQDSRTLLLENFRAYNYVAGGWRNVFTLRKSLDFRLEGYLFKPFQALLAGQNQEVTLTSDITKIYFTATAGWVLHSSVGPISLSVNYYDDAQNELGILLHVGFLLFNKSSMD